MYFGVFYSYVFGTIVTYAMLISVCTIWPVFHLIVTLFSPESPYYFYTRNDPEKLKKVMRRIKGAEYDVDSDYKEIQVWR